MRHHGINVSSRYKHSETRLAAALNILKIFNIRLSNYRDFKTVFFKHSRKHGSRERRMVNVSVRGNKNKIRLRPAKPCHIFFAHGQKTAHTAFLPKILFLIIIQLVLMKLLTELIILLPCHTQSSWLVTAVVRRNNLHFIHKVNKSARSGVPYF